MTLAHIQPNQRVLLESSDGVTAGRVRTRIEDVRPDCVVVAAPLDTDPIRLHSGDHIRLLIYNELGLHALDGVVIGFEAVPIAMVLIELRAMRVLQRRQYHRQAVALPVTCFWTSHARLALAELGQLDPEGDASATVADEPAVRCLLAYTVNLSGGGIACRATSLDEVRVLLGEMDPNLRLTVELHLPNVPLRAEAALRWCAIDEEAGHADMALEFVDLSEAQRERLIRYVFALQRSALKQR
jgi:c-di-GMP-binding flagellar brake protein YcgR